MNGVALLVFARCAGFFSRAPGFSHPAVPIAARAAFSLAVALVLWPVIRHAQPPAGPTLALALALEFCTGAATGMAASVLYDGAYAGGRVLDDYVGIHGSVPNAQYFAASAFGRVAALAFTCGLFLLGGYRIVIAALIQSFSALPPGAMPAAQTLSAYAVALPAAIIEAALLVAAPAIAGVFITQITLAALARVIPRFASFTLSFPLVFGVAMISIVIAVPAFFRSGGQPWLRLPVLSPQ